MGEERGWTELRQGRWREARAAFEAAPETAESLEGLSWSAWWLDDAEAVFDARERAYRLYRESGNAAAAARMATWLASDQLDFHGAATVAGGWLQRAHRLLDPLDTGPDHGWLAFHEGYVAYAGGDRARAIALGLEAAEIGRRFDLPDLEMLGLALQGSAQVASAQVEAGMRCLDEATATALAGEATIPISSAWTCCFLVTACTAVQDYERASEWCDRIAEFAERYGSRYMLGFCRAEYGAVELWRGRWAEAETLLEGSIEAFARSRPAHADGPTVQLAELRRRQGRTADALALLEGAGGSSRAQLCRARLALDAGDPLTAVELLERLHRHEPEPGQAPVLELLVRAWLAHGDPARATPVLEQLRTLTQLVGTTPLRAAADLAAGMIAASLDDHEQARGLLEDAVEGYERSGAAYEAAQARVELAATLAALGRTERADAEASTAARALRELGAAPRADATVTPRERVVLLLLAEGLTNRQIASRLGVSEHTVHRHVANILRKLDVPSRAAAAAHAVRAGL